MAVKMERDGDTLVVGPAEPIYIYTSLQAPSVQVKESHLCEQSATSWCITVQSQAVKSAVTS